MSDYRTTRATRYLPQVAVATTVVAFMPVAIVWWLLADGIVSSLWACIVLAIALSMIAAAAGSAYWKRHHRSGDLLFSELLIWGWWRRWRGERQLADAVASLGLEQAEARPGADASDAKRRSQLLGQLAVALDAQDPCTDGHSRRVAAHAAMVGRRMGLSNEMVAKVRAAAAVHDVGKLRTPPEILNKPGKLTIAEREIMRRHVDEGAEIVACLGDPELTAIVRHHHERFDGTGYPSGLFGEQIPLGARIVAVADTFDAITSVRPYRPAASQKQALDVLVQVSGTQLDPVAVRAFLSCYSGNRALLFWTLLAVSPQYAVASLSGGKGVAPGTASLGGTVASVAAVTSIGVVAIGAHVGGGQAPYKIQQSGRPASAQIAAASTARGLAGGGAFQTRASSVTAIRHEHAAHAAASSRTAHAAAAGGQRTSSGPGPRPSTGGPAAGGGGGAGKLGGGSGGPAGRGTGGKSAPTGKRGGGSSGGHLRGGGGAGGHSGGGSGGGGRGGSGGGPGGRGSGGTGGHSSGGGSSGSGGGGTGTGGGVGGTGGSGTGTGGSGGPAGSGGGTGGGAGGSSGSGGSGPATPTSKAQCMNGRYLQFGFPNQGQCIASVERGLH